MTRRTALLAGSSGLVGGLALTRLLASSTYDKVVTLVRRPSGLAHAKLAEKVFDFDTLEGALTLPKVDDVFCCLGTTIKNAGSQAQFRKVDFDFVVGLARATKAAGASQFLLVSALGASASSKVFYSRVKGEAEEAVKAVGFDATFIFQPSILDGHRKEHRFGERAGLVVARAVSGLLQGSLRKYRPTSADDVAHAMLTAASKGLRGVHVYDGEALRLLAHEG